MSASRIVNLQQIKQKNGVCAQTLLKVMDLYAEQFENVNLEKLDKQSNDCLHYPAHLSAASVCNLQCDAFIDHRDFNGRYLEANVCAIDRENGAFNVRYIHWDTQWNAWSHPKHEHLSFNKFGSISTRSLHRSEMSFVRLDKPFGDFIEVRPLHLRNQSKDENERSKYEQWRIAEVCMSDRRSAQVQTVLFEQNAQNGEWQKPKPKADVYWIHLDNVDECAPINTHIQNPIIIGKDKKNKKKRKLNDDDDNANSNRNKRRRTS